MRWSIIWLAGIVVAATICCGCDDVGGKDYQAVTIGEIKADNGWTPRLFIVSIEGHKYYATESSGPFLILGPEVPADSLAAIKRRQSAEYEFIDLEEVPSD